MDRLYDLLSDLLEVEHQQSALIYILDLLDSVCQQNREEKTSLLL